MKKSLLIILLALSNLAFSQRSYDGALERFRMKSDEAVRDGLIGEYYDGNNFNKLVKVRQDKQLYFDWDYESPMPELDAEYFSIRWRGKMYSGEGGKHIISAYTDDGMRIWLNGKLILNAWKDQPPRLYEKRVLLEPDQFYDIRIDYYQKQYQTTAAVFLNKDGEERIPLNANNTIFGNNLKPSKAKFDYWEEPSLVDQFFVWMGLEDEPEEEIIDQSYQPVAIMTMEKPDLTADASVEIEPVIEEEEEFVPEEKPVRIEEEVIEKEEFVKDPIVEANQESSFTENIFEKMTPGMNIRMDHIYFDQGKSNLKPESFEELDKLYESLSRHEDWSILIEGHTDNVGYAALNLELSYDRARAVYFYLIKKGIPKERLDFKGYGSNKPVAPNDTEENRKKNRRVEVSMGGC